MLQTRPSLILQGFANMPGTKETRKFVQDSHTSQRSFVSHQTFNFAGEQMSSEQRERQSHVPSTNEELEFSDDSSTPEIDHPHMRLSMDSEGGAFLSSPLGSGTNIAGAFLFIMTSFNLIWSKKF